MAAAMEWGGREAKIAGTTHLKHRPPLTRPEVEISGSNLVRSSLQTAKELIEKKDGGEVTCSIWTNEITFLGAGGAGPS